MKQPITIVSGLPRSGTSMMMRVLEAGGMPVLVDGVRRADDDNLHGYYELEVVKKLPHDTSWLGEARGKAVKIISRLLEGLPPGERYKVVFMRRPIEEVLRSQEVMLAHRGEPARAGDAGDPGDAEMRRVFLQHVAAVEEMLAGRGDVEVLFVSYPRMIAEPRAQAERVARFLDAGLDVGAMAGAVEAKLYRQRSGSTLSR